MYNRLWNCSNPNQGEAKKVLCVCSAGLLRSPTTAWVLSNPPFNFNTRAVGCDTEHALVPIDEVLITWADEVICMDDQQKDRVLEILNKTDDIYEYEIKVLNIPDRYKFRDKNLIKLITDKCRELYRL